MAESSHDKYLKLFDEHMRFVDKVADALLKGHLLIEGVLDNILETFFFNASRVRDARLSFSQKMNLARGLALGKDHLGPWVLMASINAVRNDIAHSFAGEKRQGKLDQLKRLYFAGAGSDIQKMIKEAPDEVYVAYACMECVGFLGALEDDLRALRGQIDALTAVMAEARRADS